MFTQSSLPILYTNNIKVILKNLQSRHRRVVGLHYCCDAKVTSIPIRCYTRKMRCPKVNISFFIIFIINICVFGLAKYFPRCYRYFVYKCESLDLCGMHPGCHANWPSGLHWLMNSTTCNRFIESNYSGNVNIVLYNIFWPIDA